MIAQTSSPTARRVGARTAVAVLIGALLLGACGGDDTGPASTEPVTSEPATTEPASGGGEVEAFGYEGELGPDNWGTLDEEWELCATGEEQSPIDLGPASSAELAGITVSYLPVAATVTDVGATIRADFAPGSSITVDDTTYELLQVHFHAPSEHIVNGTSADAEFHFVHKSAEGNLAVIGVLVVAGAPNDVYAPLVDAIGATPAPGAGDPIELDVDVPALMGDIGLTFRYDGSLTTPPCSEGVRWIVRAESIELSPEQIGLLTDKYEGNARPVQELGERDLLTDLPANG
jgi:carbonic anhydrase